MFMRRVSPITANIIRFPAASRQFGRRPLSSVVGHLTCLMLVKHQEIDAMVLVSDDGDAVGAVWLPKAMMSIDARDRGRFLVATLSAKLAREKNLGSPIIDRAVFSPLEAEQIEDAITTASRARKRLCGYQEPMGWSGGRNVFA
jgi:hypothetical protein